MNIQYSTPDYSSLEGLAGEVLSNQKSAREGRKEAANAIAGGITTFANGMESLNQREQAAEERRKWLDEMERRGMVQEAATYANRGADGTWSPYTQEQWTGFVAKNPKYSGVSYDEDYLPTYRYIYGEH